MESQHHRFYMQAAAVAAAAAAEQKSALPNSMSAYYTNTNKNHISSTNNCRNKLIFLISFFLSFN